MALGLLAGSTGCELIAKVDRSKIPDTDGSGGGGHGGAGSTSSTSSTSSAGGAGGGAACVPEDDNNECTDDKCKADNTTEHTPKAAGSACMNGGSMCDGNGHCVECLAPSDCPGVDDACQTRTCGADGKCGFDYAAAGTAVPMQTAGDCKETQCDGKGGTTDANKDTDVPDDKNACTDDVCTAGVPSNPPKPQGTSCGVTGMGDPLICDDMGQCVGCNAPTDCPGSDDECKARTCVNHACGVKFTAADTPIAAQTANDCLLQVCDGNGNIKAKADDNDPPKDDGNACTDEACAGGVPQHPQKPNGTGCNDGDGCTLADTCQTGICVGGSPMTCNAADQCHTAGTCDPATGMCSNPAKMDGSACDDGNPCTQTDACQAGACAGSNPIMCNALDQCHMAGTCDPATGMCSNPAQMDGSACNDGDACTQTDTCQAGACMGSNQVACNSPGPCEAASGTCNPMNGACSYTQQPDGAACVSGGSSGICQSGVCNLCGNGVKDPGEACDDNNTSDGDGCDSNCTVTGCGNGIVTAGEGCDDGNKLDNDGCSAKCAVEVPYACAGNKPSVCTSPKEINCNDGKDNDGDGLVDCADADCALACNANVGACGAGETALVYTATDVPIPIPDNSLVGATSTVTVGGIGAVKRVVVGTNIAHTYDADIDLTLMSPGGFVTDVSSDNGSNGDNYTNTIFNSACATPIASGSPPYTGCFRPEADFGAYAGAQAKGAWKLKAADDEALITGTLNAYSLALCVAPSTCGDGVVDAGETCDDGNGVLGDGCSPACTVEAGFTCAGAPSVCAPICGDGIVVANEQCDDGNGASGDGCAACVVEPGAQCKPGSPSACFPKEANCNNGLDDDGDGMVDAADPDCAIPAYFPACAAGQTLLVYNSIFVPQSIPDNTTTGVSSAILANAGGTIARAAVLFSIPHTYDADLDISLITPANATLDISSDNGSSGANYTNTVLDSTCATNVTAGSAPFSGCYKPETAFTSLVGQPANGTWTLKAADDASSDTGTLTAWKMIFCTTP